MSVLSPIPFLQYPFLQYHTGILAAPECLSKISTGEKGCARGMQTRSVPKERSASGILDLEHIGNPNISMVFGFRVCLWGRGGGVQVSKFSWPIIPVGETYWVGREFFLKDKGTKIGEKLLMPVL